MVESFRVGGAALRRIALDPLLPPPIVAKGALAALVEAMRRYDRAGRTCWAGFLREQGVALESVRSARSTPADLRMSDAAAALPQDHTPQNELPGGAP